MAYIPGMTSCTCAVDLVTKSVQRMKAMSTSKHTKEAVFVSLKKEPIDGCFSQELFAPYR